MPVAATARGRRVPGATITRCRRVPGALLPEAGVVADERRGQRAAGGEDAGAGVVVAVRVDGRHVLHLVEAVRLLVRELGVQWERTVYIVLLVYCITIRYQ